MRRVWAGVVGVVLAGSAVTAVGTAAEAAPAAPVVAAGQAASAVGDDPAGTYRPIVPFRAGGATSIGPGQTSPVVIDQPRSGLPSGDGYAAVVNVTAFNVTADTYVTVFPHGSAWPGTSNLNLSAGGWKVYAQATTAVVKVVDGKIDVFNAAGSVEIYVDVVGFYPIGATYTSIQPRRLLDTRKGQPTADGKQSGGGPLAGGSSLSVPVAGRVGIPGTGVAGVFATLTAVSPTQSTWVTAYPSGQNPPLASNLNPGRGQVLPNLVYVPLGTDGAVSLRNALGSTDLILDVVGYVASAGTTFHSLRPTRFLDTRAGEATFDGKAQGEGPLRDSEVRAIPVAGRAGIPASATSVVVNLTAVNPSSGSYVSVGSATAEGWNPREASALNPQGPVTTNLAIVRLDLHGNMSAFVGGGAVDLVMDVVGWSDAILDPHISLAVKNTAGGFPASGTAPVALTSDGSTLLFQTGGTDVTGGPGVGAATLATGQQVSVLDRAGYDGSSVSEDGRYLAVSSNQDPAAGWTDLQWKGIWTYDRSARSWTRIAWVDQVNFFDPAISGDGRFVAYTDASTDDGAVYLWDRQSGKSSPLLTDAQGRPVPSGWARLSRDGQLALFSSPAALVPGLSTGWHLFVLDRRTGAVSLVPTSSGTTGIATSAGFSADGNRVLYVDSWGTHATVVVDRAAGTAATLGETGSQALSADGRFVCFSDGGVSEPQVRRYSVAAGSTRLVTTTRAGTPVAGGGSACTISGDGRYVAFASSSTAILPATPVGVGQTYVADLGAS